MKDTIFGRKQPLDLLTKRVGDLKEGYRQNVALLGDELVGKSSILFSLLSKYNDPQTLLFYIEVRPEKLTAFAKRFIGIVLYTTLCTIRTPAKEDLQLLITDAGKFLPRTAEKAKNILAAIEKRKKLNVFSELLSLSDLIYQDTGKFCVIIFDEFHYLERLGIPQLYQEWSKLLMVQKTTMYIITSSLKHKAKTILTKNLSLLFGNFETMLIEPFDIRASEEYLKEKLLGAALNQGQVNFLVNFTGGVPFYLNIISSAFVKSAPKRLADVLEELLFEPAGILHQRFSSYLQRYQDAKCSQDYTDILYQIACGNNKIKDLSHLLHMPLTELTLRIQDLIEYNCISKTGDFLMLNDRIFGFWLKFVYQKKLQSLTFDAKNQKSLFLDHIESIIREFLLQAQKPILERMTELLRLFEDDVVQFEKKKMKLDHFREIKSLSFGTRALRDGILGRSHDSVWIMAFKREQITEEDVSDFTKECKKYRNKLQTKIIVTAKDVDANAKLRAMEEKIFTWDLNHLNRIFDLYSKPRIIA